MSKSRKVAYYGILSALAILMGYVETMIPMPVPIPGVKIGLSNIVVLLALYVMGSKDGSAISVVRVAVSALLFKGFAGFWYSLAGAALSYIVMMPLSKSKKVSIIGTSVAGGVFHNIGQIIVAWRVLGRGVVLYLIPVLMVSGIVTGIGIGLVSKYCIVYTDRHIIK
jgi:heptaprenyl diphosphate synthase